MDNPDARLDCISQPDYLVQNASFLPRQYGKTLHTSSMVSVADSEVQFLDILETQLEQHQASAATVELQAFHAAMDYIKIVLPRHIEALEENISTIEHREKTNWHPESSYYSVSVYGKGSTSRL
ncbi:hypothetical protein MMC29_004517 [Sticta canariensis]|nr:hypothetical protein [Sticta canariensis]